MRPLKIGFWALLFIALVAISVSFATQNNDLMTLYFFNNMTEARPKWQILLCATLIGAFLSALFFIVELIILESKNIVLRRMNRKLERALQLQSPKEPTQVSPTLINDDIDNSDV